MSRSPSALDDTVVQSPQPPEATDQNVSEPTSKLTQDGVEAILDSSRTKTDESPGADNREEPVETPVFQVNDANTNYNNNSNNVINMTI